MRFREAQIEDIDGMHHVRCAVLENKLPSPAAIPMADYVMMLHNGFGWVCERYGRITGFTIVDMPKKNLWALFVHPGFERQGIGRNLHRLMIETCLQQDLDMLWLCTAPNTRAESFYRRAGWLDKGPLPNGEVKLEYWFSK
ncbi:MAG: family acetyltransferase [Flavipsychrobacter sp.]|jgi:GNAT superfamily N-acetyltransferase|nr:family acetyltransferase [Flavipsychrobacter sp.]